MMEPTWESDCGRAKLWLADCLDVLPTIPDGAVDAVVTDPPYGMNWNTDSTRFSGGDLSSRLRRGAGKNSPAVINDSEPFDPSPWLSFPNVILWGSNHYAARLPVGTTLVWIKRLDGGFGSFLSDAELAWMKGGHGVYCYRDLSMMAEAKHRLHPTQKPIPMMKWCIEKTSGTILDPFMGSGTTGVAAIKLGRDFWGIELEPKYFDIAKRRIIEALQADDFLSGKVNEPNPQQEMAFPASGA